jgi:hypothetical protein
VSDVGIYRPLKSEQRVKVGDLMAVMGDLMIEKNQSDRSDDFLSLSPLAFGRLVCVVVPRLYFRLLPSLPPPRGSSEPRGYLFASETPPWNSRGPPCRVGLYT